MADEEGSNWWIIIGIALTLLFIIVMVVFYPSVAEVAIASINYLFGRFK